MTPRWWAGRMGTPHQRSWVGHTFTLITLCILTSVTIRVFRTPYPLSSRCQVPMEDPTNRGFCRPLPVDLFPIEVLPEMPREGQPTFTLSWLRVLFSTGLPYL